MGLYDIKGAVFQSVSNQYRSKVNSAVQSVITWIGSPITSARLTEVDSFHARC